MANSVDLDQTASEAVWSGSALFAYIMYHFVRNFGVWNFSTFTVCPAICFTYFQRQMAKLFANSGDPDQILHSAASDLSSLFANYPFRGFPSKMD